MPPSRRPGSSPFATRVFAWFDRHGRKDLPWQRDISPYRVWVSEIMLQQTQVQTVIPYFERFHAALPDVRPWRAGEDDRVLHLWTGLGYYARARNLHRARSHMRRIGGDFPTRWRPVRTAGHRPLHRRSHREHRLRPAGGDPRRQRQAGAGPPPGGGRLAGAERVCTTSCGKSPMAYTPAALRRLSQAMMDLGATLCTRTAPDCGRCPLAADCAALAPAAGDFPGSKPRKHCR